MEFILKTKINASAEAIYKTWLNSESHTNMTGGEAKASDKVGESFTAWDGYIEGKNIELIPNKKIVQSWRTSEFKEYDEDSKIEILLNENAHNTELTLIHSNVPKDGEQYKNGWKEHYFKPMKAYFTE